MGEDIELITQQQELRKQYHEWLNHPFTLLMMKHVELAAMVASEAAITSGDDRQRALALRELADGSISRDTYQKENKRLRAESIARARLEQQKSRTSALDLGVRPEAGAATQAIKGNIAPWKNLKSQVART